jgi:putative two-component system response regulator
VTAVAERLQSIDASLSSGVRVDATTLRDLATEVSAQPLHGDPSLIAELGVRICQRLHGAGRSIEGLPLAANLAEAAWEQLPHTVAARILNACSFLSIDAADYTRAFDCLGRVLEVREAENDLVAVSRTWVNIANSMSGGGLLASSESAFSRAISMLDGDQSPRFSRFVSWVNLIRSAQIRGDLEAASEFAARARAEHGRNIPDVTTLSQCILHRNQARLWIETGDRDAARRELDALARAAEIDGTLRAKLALASTQAIFDLFHGSSDVALTRLDEVLRKARASSQHLTDMLGFVARIELKLGSTLRAEHHLSELKRHAHRLNVTAVSRNQALSQLLRQFPDTDALLRQLSQLHRQEVELHRAPQGWDALRRIAVGNAAQVDLTGTHGLRVGRLVRLHAQALNLPPLRAAMLGFAAELHDIGLPSEHDGLNPLHAVTQLGEKPSDLLHCESGATILSVEQHPWLLVAQDMARYHHAHWDGSGYPASVAREAIPWEARLCAVSDTFDTIVQDRFADESSVRAALDALRALAGRQLDPELVESFARAVTANAEDEDIQIESPSGTRHFLNLLAAVRPKELV